MIASKLLSGSSVAVFICFLKSLPKEKVALLSVEEISLTSFIEVLTFLIALPISPATLLKASVSPTPLSFIFSAVFEVIVESSVVSVKSILSISCSGLFFSASPRSLTVSTTDSIAMRKASSKLAPAPSTAEEIAVTVFITWWAICSTTRACSWSTLSLNGLKVVGSTPSGNPNMAPISSALIPPSSIIVVVGETISEPTGAVSIILARISPDEVSIVVSSVVTEKLYPLNPTILKVPSVFVRVKGSFSSIIPLKL